LINTKLKQQAIGQRRGSYNCEGDMEMVLAGKAKLMC